MTLPHPDPLTPDERDLAQRLSRIGPHGEPSSALDARILAAAHRALAESAPRRRSRWPAAMGVAASLMLAIGLAWQLRPQPETMPALEEGPAQSAATTAHDATLETDAETARDAAAGTGEVAARDDAPAVDSFSVEVPAAPPRVVPPVAQAVTAPPEEPPVMAAPATAREQAAMVDDTVTVTGSRVRRDREPLRAAPEPPAMAAPAGMAEAAADMAAPPPAPPAPPTPPRAPAEARAAKAASAPTASADDARAFSANAPESNAALSDTPIAEDAHLPPTTWLDRIRARRDGGDADGARASLRLFRDRYPNLPIPNDLRALSR